MEAEFVVEVVEGVGEGLDEEEDCCSKKAAGVGVGVGVEVVVGVVMELAASQAPSGAWPSAHIRVPSLIPLQTASAEIPWPFSSYSTTTGPPRATTWPRLW